MSTIIWRAVAEYGKNHSPEETDLVARKLLGLGPANLFSRKKIGRDDEVWRTSEEGHHFKLESKTGEIKAGFGGTFNGEKASEAFKNVPKPKKSRPKSVDETAEMIAGKRNLFSNKQFTEASRKWAEGRRQSQELWEKSRDLRERLEKEISFPDDESRGLGRQYAEMFGWYTDKGKELKKELDQIEKQRGQIEKEAKKSERQADLLKAKQSLKELQDWEEPPLKETKKTKFDGFTLESDIPDIRDAIQSGRAKIVEMSPKEYLERCAHQIFDGSTLEHTIAGTDPEKFNKYADQMENGEEFAIPYLNFTSRQQEGRHRALAAMMNGYEKIPVAVIGEPMPKWMYESNAKMNLSEAERETWDEEEPELPDDLLLEEPEEVAYDPGAAEETGGGKAHGSHKADNEIREYLRGDFKLNRKDLSKHIKGTPQFNMELERRKRLGKPPQSYVEAGKANEVESEIIKLLKAGNYKVHEKGIGGEKRVFVSIATSGGVAYNIDGIETQSKRYCVPVSIRKGIHFYAVPEEDDE